MSGGAGTVGENRYNTRRSGDSTSSNVTETTASKSKKAPSCLILLGQLKLKATVSTKSFVLTCCKQLAQMGSACHPDFTGLHKCAELCIHCRVMFRVSLAASHFDPFRRTPSP